MFAEIKWEEGFKGFEAVDGWKDGSVRGVCGCHILVAVRSYGLLLGVSHKHSSRAPSHVRPTNYYFGVLQGVAQSG